MIMKSIFNPGQYTKNINIALLLLRTAAGIFMLTHGMSKLFLLFNDAPVQFADPVGMGPALSLWLTVFAEVLCSFLLIFGFATRFAAVPLFINMFVAAIVVHAGDVFKTKELAFFYLVIFAIIAIAEAGKYSVNTFAYRYLYRNA